MVSFIQLIKTHTAKPKQATRKDDFLYGSGTTKRAMLAEEARLERVLTDEAIQSRLKQEVIDSIDKVRVVTLPVAETHTAAPTKWQWDPDQQKAIDEVPLLKHANIIGRAGCGKTTLLRAILEKVIQGMEVIDWRRNKRNGVAMPRPIELPPVAIISFTGRAVDQARSKLPGWLSQLCMTGHSLLGFYPEYYETDEGKNSRRFVPFFHAQNKLKLKALFIDEAGMVDTNFWALILAALPSDCRIYTFGDLNQLQPVQGKPILGFTLLKWPTYELKTLHRNAGPIAVGAHEILNGRIPKFDKKQLFHFPLDGGSEKARSQFLGQLLHAEEKGIWNKYKDVALVPQNVGPLGQIELNERLMIPLNPPKKDSELGITVNPRVTIDGGITKPILAVGDRIMLLANDNDRQLFNGMTGVVVNIAPNPAYKSTGNMYGTATHVELSEEDMEDLFSIAEIEADEGEVESEDTKQRPASHVLTVRFDTSSSDIARIEEDIEVLEMRQADAIRSYDGITRWEYTDHKGKTVKETMHINQIVRELQEKHVELSKARAGFREVEYSTRGHYKNLTISYARTGHKSQGGEHECVFILLHSANSKMLTRELLYTMWTRAKKIVVLCCNSRGLQLALQRQAIKGNTLVEKIEHFRKMYHVENSDDSRVYIPEAVRLDQEAAE